MTQEDFDSWMDHPVTQALFHWVEGKRTDLKDMWANGAFTGPSWDETHIKNVAATGAASAYEEVLDIEFDQLNEVERETGR